MTKSKYGCLVRIPKEQKCHFFIGPECSWFMPNTTDLWTQPMTGQIEPTPDTTRDVLMDCDKQPTTRINSNSNLITDTSSRLSYFVYGSLGCFCYGEIYHRNQQQQQVSSVTNHEKLLPHSVSAEPGSQPRVGAIVKQLVDIKDDNSRVSCTRFLKNSPFPLVLALTESGSLLIYDCIGNEPLVHYKKLEVLAKFADLPRNDGNHPSSVAGGDQPNAKRAKFTATQQINSCAWPREDTILLGVSLLKEETCLLLRLKVKSMLDLRNKPEQIDKNDVITEHHKIDLDIDDYYGKLCLIEAAMLDEKICIVAVGTNDGLIKVISYNLDTNQKLRTIKLVPKHHDSICSMSLLLSNPKKFPLGLLASVSRDGLVRVWNIETENYFADYMAIPSATHRESNTINWFSLSFITFAGLKSTCLAVSNIDSGLNILEIPENTRSSIRLRVSRDAARSNKNRQAPQGERTIRHNALIFNIEYDPVRELLITSSLDGNQILWSIIRTQTSMDNKVAPIEARPQFLCPAMPNSARTHMLRFSPIREDLIAMALGKAGLRFLNISENLFDSKFDMTQSCSQVAHKIIKSKMSPTSIAWHPNHEYRLAIGTLDGLVYRADITPRKFQLTECEHQSYLPATKNANLTNVDDILEVDYQPVSRESTTSQSNQRSTRTDGVYSLCWGPNPTHPQDVSKHAIYAVGSVSNRLFIYYSNKDTNDKLTNYLDEFRDTSLPEAAGQASEVAWKSSMDLMALGTSDGRILVVTYLEESHHGRSNNKLFRLLAVVQGPFEQARIQCLAWNPTNDIEDYNYYKLVASSSESPAFVFNLKETILVADVREKLRLEQSRDGQSSGTHMSSVVNILATYVNKLDAHKKAITDIAWNPHEPNQLATCSFDRTCYVWSLDNCLMDAQIAAKFSGRDRLFTLEWSLVDDNLIYTSGNDSIIWAWRPTENRV